MSDCIFCRIGNKEMTTNLVHEDDDTFAFEDIAPQAPTHLLICPRQHVASLADAGEASEPALGHLFTVAARLARERGLEAYRTVVNTGADAGQSVLHLHVHVLGGRPMRWPPG